MNRVLVIGGSGFAGRYLVGSLIREGYEVFALQHAAPVEGISGDHIIRGGIGAVDRKLVRDLRPEVVFHFARPKYPRLRKAGRVLAAFHAARLNRRLVLEIAASGQPARLVFASGSLMYGSSGTPADESSPLRPASFARQYHRGEKPVLDALERGLIPVSVLRFPWLLGKGSWFEWFYLRAMKSHRSVPLFGEGNNRMEVLDMEDAARLAIHYAFRNADPGIYNMISPGAVTQRDFATAVSRASGLPVKDFRDVFPGRPEKEALEAFTSDIIMKTRHPDLIKGFIYTPLKDTLDRILAEYGPF